MSKIITNPDIELSDILKNNNKLLIICKKEINIPYVSINTLLAPKLVNEIQFPSNIADIIRDFFFKYNKNTLFNDIDLLFSPKLKFDVISMLSSYAKEKPLAIIWPGTFKNNKLIYAEYGYQDHKEFEINNYDITIVI